MKSIFILTGAGISAESGIKTFRAADGLWEDHRVEDVATPEAFIANPDLVHRFYNARRAQLKTVEPNAAHQALARLQRDYKQGTVMIVTQNVDDLHERAGADVIHMHGELRKLRCTHCRTAFEWTKDAHKEMSCPHCERSGDLRPDIVWFGEIPYHMETIRQALTQSAIFVAIGTSGAVYPAAGFVQEAIFNGIETLEINLEKTQSSSLFHRSSFGKATQSVSDWVQAVLE